MYGSKMQHEDKTAAAGRPNLRHTAGKRGATESHLPSVAKGPNAIQAACRNEWDGGLRRRLKVST